VVTAPAGAPTTKRLANLDTGVTYNATTVGICADGTRTLHAVPVSFTPSLPPQPPSISVAVTTPTSAVATVTPPPNGCVPVTYEITYTPANSAAEWSVVTAPAGAPTTKLLSKLDTGVTYNATAVGICADGTRTPPSVPARFTPSLPPPSPPPPPSLPPPSPPPPLAGQAPTINVTVNNVTSATAEVRPSPSGCVPVTFEITYAPVDTPAAWFVVTAPAGSPTTKRLDNLVTGVTYNASTVGVCADGTRTPPSTPVRFTPSKPTPYAYVSNYYGNVSICYDFNLTDCEKSPVWFTNGIVRVGTTTYLTDVGYTEKNGGVAMGIFVCYDLWLANCTYFDDNAFYAGLSSAGRQIDYFKNQLWIANQWDITTSPMGSLTVCDLDQTTSLLPTNCKTYTYNDDTHNNRPVGIKAVTIGGDDYIFYSTHPTYSDYASRVNEQINYFLLSDLVIKNATVPFQSGIVYGPECLTFHNNKWYMPTSDNDAVNVCETSGTSIGPCTVHNSTGVFDYPFHVALDPSNTTVYVGNTGALHGATGFVSICPVDNLDSCTWTNGGGTFSAPGYIWIL
jgi:hypothetical protein